MNLFTKANINIIKGTDIKQAITHLGVYTQIINANHSNVHALITVKESCSELRYAYSIELFQNNMKVFNVPVFQSISNSASVIKQSLLNCMLEWEVKQCSFVIAEATTIKESLTSMSLCLFGENEFNQLRLINARVSLEKSRALIQSILQKHINDELESAFLYDSLIEGSDWTDEILYDVYVATQLMPFDVTHGMSFVTPKGDRLMVVSLSELTNEVTLSKLAGGLAKQFVMSIDNIVSLVNSYQMSISRFAIRREDIRMSAGYCDGKFDVSIICNKTERTILRDKANIYRTSEMLSIPMSLLMLCKDITIDEVIQNYGFVINNLAITTHNADVVCDLSMINPLEQSLIISRVIECTKQGRANDDQPCNNYNVFNAMPLGTEFDLLFDNANQQNPMTCIKVNADQFSVVGAAIKKLVFSFDKGWNSASIAISA
jgi:hypothetical protein